MTSGRGSLTSARVAVFGTLTGGLLLAGCAARGPTLSRGSDGAVVTAPGGPSLPAAGSRPPAAESQSWVRAVSPFQVRDSTGRPYDLPFLGGLDAPRPQLVDIDGDGDVDLFIQEATGRLMFLEREDDRIESPGGPGFVWRTDRFADLDIGEWYRFADADGDGDWDLLSESPYNYVRLYENEGGATSPRFVLAQDTLRDDRDRPIFSDRQNIPNAADLDCDGTLDLLVGRVVGTITRYEATSVTNVRTLAFRNVTDRFEDIEIVADPAATSPTGVSPALPGPFERVTSAASTWGDVRHGANTMALADPDEDGDLDLLWGDFFEPGLLYIENAGSCASPNLRGEPQPFPPGDPIATSGYNAPTFGDLDRDGDLDLLVGVLGGAFDPNRTAADNLLALTREEDGRLVVSTRRFLYQIDLGSESIPVLVDLDADGDLDLVVGNRVEPGNPLSSGLYLFRNAGGPLGPAGGGPDTRTPIATTVPSFDEVGRFDFSGDFHYAPAFGDLDGDGDLDLVLGSWRPELQLFENVGTSTTWAFESADPSAAVLSRGSNATPTLGDLDADGDLDLLVGEASGAINFFRNEGDPSRPRFVLVDEEYVSSEGTRRAAPVLLDWDRDGDLDLAVGTERAGILYYENRGSPLSPDFLPAPSPFPTSEGLPALAAPAFGDLDGNGELDLLSGGRGGGLIYFRR